MILRFSGALLTSKQTQTGTDTSVYCAVSTLNGGLFASSSILKHQLMQMIPDLRSNGGRCFLKLGTSLLGPHCYFKLRHDLTRVAPFFYPAQTISDVSLQSTFSSLNCTADLNVDFSAARDVPSGRPPLLQTEALPDRGGPLGLPGSDCFQRQPPAREREHAGDHGPHGIWQDDPPQRFGRWEA
jgi:hypothetical protein